MKEMVGLRERERDNDRSLEVNENGRTTNGKLTLLIQRGVFVPLDKI
jgi:hypothetical protein